MMRFDSQFIVIGVDLLATLDLPFESGSMILLVDDMQWSIDMEAHTNYVKNTMLTMIKYSI